MKHSSSRSLHLLHEHRPRYDAWLKLILGGTLAFTLALGITLLPVDMLGAQIVFGVTLFDALIFHAVLPRRYQIFEDRMRIILGYPFAVTIHFSTIKKAKQTSGSKALVCWGIRFATSTKGVVEIIRYKGLKLVISPHDAGTFLENLNQALRSFENYHLDKTSLQKS